MGPNAFGYYNATDVANWGLSPVFYTSIQGSGF